MSTAHPAEGPSAPSSDVRTGASSTGDVSSGRPSNDRAAADTGSAPARPRSRYSMGTAANMVRSLVVIVALILLLVAIVPRVTHVEQPAVDAGAVASYQAQQTGLPLQVATGLPDGWKATTATYGPGAAGLPTWTAGWTTPSGGFVGVRQARDTTAPWLDTVSAHGTPSGSRSLGGATWQVLRGDDQQVTYDRSVGDLTTAIATKDATDAEVTTFAAALHPAR